jgi:hypothetical protein
LTRSKYRFALRGIVSASFSSIVILSIRRSVNSWHLGHLSRLAASNASVQIEHLFAILYLDDFIQCG